MGQLKFEVPHTLTRDEAKKRVEMLTKHWSEKYGVQTTWAGDAATVSGKVMGISIQAQLTVADKTVGGEAGDPGFLFRDKAKKYLQQKFEAALSPGGANFKD